MTTAKMDPKIKKKWVKLLRSGKLPQTQGALYRPKEETREDDDTPYPAGYCCLGVLALACDWKPSDLRDTDGEALGLLSQLQYEDDAEFGMKTLREEYDGYCFDYDPYVVLEINGYSRRVSLSSLNDTHSFSFSKIADVIEAQL